jgi:hypothetical protein
MNDITSLNRISSLSSYLHEEFVECGEVLPAASIAQIVTDCEFDGGTQFTEREILIAVREAQNLTCESYIGNAYDSTDWTHEQREREIAKWEALRPKRIREKQIADTLSVAAIEQKKAPTKEINRTQVYNAADAATTALRASMTALLNLQDGLFDAGREESANEVSLMIDSVVSAACRLESLANVSGNIYL